MPQLQAQLASGLSVPHANAMCAHLDAIRAHVIAGWNNAWRETRDAARDAICGADEHDKPRIFKHWLQCWVDRSRELQQELIVHLQPLPAKYGIPYESLSEWLPKAFDAVWVFFYPMYLGWIIGVLEKGKTPASWVAPQWLWAVENVAHLTGDHPIATKMLLDLISANVERKLIEGQGGRDEVMSQAYLPIISAAAHTQIEPQESRATAPADELAKRVAQKLGNPSGYPTMSVEEAACAFAKSKQTIYRWVDEKKLTSSGAPGRILTKSIVQLLNRNDARAD